MKRDKRELFLIFYSVQIVALQEHSFLWVERLVQCEYRPAGKRGGGTIVPGSV